MDLESVLIGVAHGEGDALLIQAGRAVEVVLPDPLSLVPRTDPEQVGDLQVVQEGQVYVFGLHR